MVTERELRAHVRYALKHLYDPSALRSIPLARILGLGDRPDACSRLRQRLIETIESLEPSEDTPADSDPWRIYEVLLCRYVQQCTQEDVAYQLGLSIRHLRRIEKAAQLAVCDRLAADLDLLLERPSSDEAPEEEDETESEIRDELAWLRQRPLTETVEWNLFLPAVLDVAQALAARHGVELVHPTPASSPSIRCHRAALRQAMLSLLAVAIRHAAAGRVAIRARGQEDHVDIHVETSEPLARAIGPEDHASLDMARRLLSTFEGALSITAAEGTPLQVTLTVPGSRRVPVLVVDDNADALHVLQRYAAGTRYHICGLADPRQVLAVVRDIQPQIIVLDVMMPDLDGWELLGRLREHPLTRHIPVLVCTILVEEDLALSLGAASFLRKPVSRQAFLQALDAQMQARPSAVPQEAEDRTATRES